MSILNYLLFVDVVVASYVKRRPETKSVNKNLISAVLCLLFPFKQAYTACLPVFSAPKGGLIANLRI